MTNKDLAAHFTQLAKLYDIHRIDDDASKAFANAAFAIDRYQENIINLPIEQVEKIRNIGKNIASKIEEIKNSNQIEATKSLIEKTPIGILELMTIKGIGPKKIATIWHDLNIASPGELLYACNENRLTAYKGFGEKTQQNIAEAVAYFLENQGSLLYSQALLIANHLKQDLQKIFGDESVFIVGAITRQLEIVDEIEFVIQTNAENLFEALAIHPLLTLKEENQDSFTYQFENRIDVIIYFSDEDDLSTTLFYTSSSPEFIDEMEIHFPTLNYSQAYSNLDESIFDAAGIPYILPCLRDHKGIIEMAKQQKLPTLINSKDIKGVIHAHSTWSDGKHSIKEMALAAKALGYEYLVMSDHSVTSFYANGLNVDQILKQHEEIDLLNESLKPFKIFKSIECDILSEGQLDYSDDILATFDLVICSIHQNLTMTLDKAMSRILNALKNPYTTILAHPTGRLLLSRKGYPIDIDVIIAACLKNKTAIEINANPRRLDIDWRLIHQITSAGVKVSINPDAHSTEGIKDIEYGVRVAQKGLLTKENNLSTMSLIDFEAFLETRKQFFL